MPRLSDSMEEGTILKWLKADGEAVTAGDELLEVETDKATVTVNAEISGVLRIVVEEGATVSVGAVIAETGAAGEHAGNGAAPEPEPTPRAKASEPARPAAAMPLGNGGGRAATPLARRAARAHGVSLEAVSGTGPRGRITRSDVLAAAGVAPAPPPAAPAPPTAAAPPLTAPAREAPSASGGTEPVPLTRIQQVIARRMSESRSAIPEFEVQTEVAMDEALALRKHLREALGDAPVPSLNDLIVKAAALALRRHPRMNASYIEDRLQMHGQVNVGVAVATDDALIVPTVRDADTRSLGALAAEARRLAGSVRAGTVTPEELSGATFTVSNLGMFGMTAIRPIINAPQVGILGVGAAREVLALVDGQVSARHVMTLTLSCDHRAVYGADAARFLSEVRSLLEAPLQLLL
jgi:pyruvate dehydrogenase E2 component (dihydrolipoamide acetyltransferase)